MGTIIYFFLHIIVCLIPKPHGNCSFYSALYLSKYDIINFVPTSEKSKTISSFQRELRNAKYRGAVQKKNPYVLCLKQTDIIKLLGILFYREEISMHVSPCKKSVFLSYKHFVVNLRLRKVVGDKLFESIKKSINSEVIYNLNGIKPSLLKEIYIKKRERKSSSSSSSGVKPKLKLDVESTISTDDDSHSDILIKNGMEQDISSPIDGIHQSPVLSLLNDYNNNNNNNNNNDNAEDQENISFGFDSVDIFDCFHESFDIQPLFGFKF